MRRAIACLCFCSSWVWVGCSSQEKSESVGPVWRPGTVYTTDRAASLRGMLDLRGLIHAHSVYSHDACDNAPKDDAGNVNLPCLADFRKGLCTTRHDFVFLSDHNESFSSTEYPLTLLYDASQGDQLLERDGKPVANWLACKDQDPPLVIAGTESAAMPVGLEGHVPGTVEERASVYGAATPAAIDTEKAQHAVALAQHTEDWTVDQLVNLPFDGFEMYNLHANAIRGAGAAMGLLSKLAKSPEDLPYPDLVFLPLFSEDPRYLDTWGSVLASGVHRVTTMATDCHQNAFPQIMPDGERIDSYRRMMSWFSNHLLVRPDASGKWGDRELKDALGAGRLYGAFEVMGYPTGFDFHAESSAGIVEMGGEVALSAGPSLVAKKPRVEKADPRAKPPEITLRLLRAKPDGWDVVAETGADLASTPTDPGAYRVEVRMKPRHLLKYLSSYSDLAEQDFVWIYSNPIFVK